jgi:hypothetical protein
MEERETVGGKEKRKGYNRIRKKKRKTPSL